MRVSIRTRRGKLDPTAREWLSRRIEFALGRFGARISRVAVQLEDVNGPRGGLDHRCLVEVHLIPAGRLLTEVVDEDLEPAASAALDRMARRVKEEFDRRRDLRRGPDAGLGARSVLARRPGRSRHARTGD